MTIRSLIALVALLAAFAAAPRPAVAQQVAYAVPGTTNVRAGPGTEYPVITQVVGGETLYVYGCLSNYLWCDVLAHGIRGWMYAPRMQFAYNGTYVQVPNYYRYFGAPIIGFDFGYWDRYYTDYPWYRSWRGGRDRPPRRYDDGDVTNYPGVEHPGRGGTGSYQAPPPQYYGGGGQPGGGNPGVSGGPTPAPGGGGPNGFEGGGGPGGGPRGGPGGGPGGGGSGGGPFGGGDGPGGGPFGGGGGGGGAVVCPPLNPNCM